MHAAYLSAFVCFLSSMLTIFTKHSTAMPGLNHGAAVCPPDV